MFHSLRLPFIAIVMAAGTAWLLLPEETTGRFTDTMDTVERLADLMPAAGDPAADVALHKAVYDFKMVSAESGSGVSGIKGKMYYEQDDTCDAWTTDHRFTIEYQYPERRPVINTSHYVAWEAKDQSQFSYSSERQENKEQVELLRGSVIRKEDGTARAEYSRPDELYFDLPAGYYLPTHHTLETIRRAAAGEKVFNAVLFDGTDAEGPVEVNTIIGGRVSQDMVKQKIAPEQKIDESLLQAPAWRVRMAVFPLKEEGQMLPSYEMDMVLHDNGVVSYALVDYKAFKVEQRLQALEKLPHRKCE